MRQDDRLDSVRLDDLQKLDALLERLLAQTAGRCALVLSRGGQLLSAAGDLDGMDQTSFATLAAADFAASDQLALLLGETEFTSLYHEGEGESMYLAAAGGRAILAVLFDAGTTLGMVRVRTREALPHFAAVLEEAAAHPRGAGAGVDLGSGWAQEAEGEIDRLFAE